jgi:hypothetical protein
MGRVLRSSFVGIALAVAPLIVVGQQGTREYPECTHQPSENDISAAKGAFQAGQVSFNEADYDRAITYWEDAYRRDCTAHAMLLNLARAYELHGNARQAVVSLETYLARNPSSPQRDQINRRIEVLKEKIAAQPVSTDTAGMPGTGNPGGTPPPATTATGAPPDTGTGKKPILPLIVAGAGGAIALIGGVLYLGATSDFNEAEDACPTHQNCPPGVEEDGDSAVRRQRVSAIVGIGGLVIAAGGLVWYFMSPEEPTTGSSAPPAPRTRVSPTWAPGYAGVSLGGSF